MARSLERRARCLGLAVAGLLLTMPAGAGAQQGDSVRVSGHVVDRSTGRSLPFVSVRFVVPGPTEREAWRGATDASGLFRSSQLPGGVYEVRAEALGFEDVAASVVLRGARELDLRMELVPDAVELEPILVTSYRRTRLEASGFYQRRRMGLGHTFTREEIEARAPFRVSDLFRMVPGADIVGVRGGRSGAVQLRRGCTPDLVVDGIRIPNPGPIDDVLSVGDLEALEVYHGSSPSLTLTTSTCGVIKAWTRQGGAQEGGELPRLDRFVVALSVIAISFLLTR
jgi:hypothetical protein